MNEAPFGRKADDDAEDRRAGGEGHERECHHARGLVRVVVEMVIPRLSVEGHPQGARDVERGEDGGDDPDRVEHDLAVGERGAEYLVLPPEPGKWRERRG